MTSHSFRSNNQLQAFYVEVIFSSKARRIMPGNGYRPHIILQKDLEKNYLGVIFTGFSGNESFDKTCLVKIKGAYDAMDYSAMSLGDLFWVKEGAMIVAKERIIESVIFCGA